MIEAAIFVIFPLCMAVTAISDTFSMTIPNRVSIILLASFLVIAPFAGLTPAQIGLHLLAGLAVFAVCFVLFAINGMGGGDAKVLTASAVWFGLGQNLLVFLIAVSMIGGLLTIVFVLMRGRNDVMMIANRVGLPSHFTDQKAGIPYGIAIGIAGFVCYPQSPLMLFALERLA